MNFRKPSLSSVNTFFLISLLHILVVSMPVSLSVYFFLVCAVISDFSSENISVKSVHQMRYISKFVKSFYELF